MDVEVGQSAVELRVAARPDIPGRRDWLIVSAWPESDLDRLTRSVGATWIRPDLAAEEPAVIGGCRSPETFALVAAAGRHGTYAHSDRTLPSLAPHLSDDKGYGRPEKQIRTRDAAFATTLRPGSAVLAPQARDQPVVAGSSGPPRA